MRSLLRVVERAEVRAGFPQKTNDFELRIERPCRPARASRLGREVQGGRATRAQTAVSSCAEGEQLAYRADAPGSHCPMQGSRTAAIALVQPRATSSENFEHDALSRRIPGAGQARPWVTRVVKRSRSASVLRVRICTGLEKKESAGRLQRRSGEMQRGISYVEPVRDGRDQQILRRSDPKRVRSSAQDSGHVRFTLQHRVEDGVQSFAPIAPPNRANTPS